MGLSSALTNPAVQLVADASAIISLIATGSAGEVIAALPNRVVVVDTVLVELEAGRQRGRSACDGLRDLVTAEAVGIVTLDSEEALRCFEDLVVGPAAATLDDGEAATIAYALTRASTAVIDERKAIRICRERFPGLQTGCTVDVLLHADVERSLGPEMIGNLMFNALIHAHMRVLPEHVPWVVSVVGPERALTCESLPRSVRNSLLPANRIQGA